MLFVFILTDNPGTAALRTEVRPAHRAYLAEVADRMAFAGPMLADDGETALGSLLVIDFADRAAAVAWLAAEPYTRAGVYGPPQLHAFRNLWPQRIGFAES